MTEQTDVEVVALKGEIVELSKQLAVANERRFSVADLAHLRMALAEGITSCQRTMEAESGSVTSLGARQAVRHFMRLRNKLVEMMEPANDNAPN